MARKKRSSIHKRARALRKKEKKVPVIKSRKKIISTKKSIPKRISKSISKPAPKIITKVVHKKTGSSDVEKKLVENFIALQKVMVNLSIKFDTLSNKISKLLDLFEISAKSLAKKDFKMEKPDRDEQKVIQKLDNLVEQNKIIARGLTLMHDKIGGQERPVQRVMRAPPPRGAPPQMPRPPPGQRMAPPTQGAGEEQYQKSLSDEPTKFKKLPGSPDRTGK